MKESSNDSYFFGSSTNLKRLNEQKSTETNMNVLLEIEKQKIEEEANAKYISIFMENDDRYSKLFSKYQDLEINYKNLSNNYEVYS